MFSSALWALPLLGSFAAALEANVTVYTEENCGGDADTLYIDVSSAYCFNTAGKSFNNYNYDLSYLIKKLKYCEIITYSNTDCPFQAVMAEEGYGTCALYGVDLGPGNCNGSYTDIFTIGDCETVPFASVSINCTNYLGWL